MLAANADKFDPVRVHIARGKGGARVFQEGRATRFGADENKARIRHAAQYGGPGINAKLRVFIGIIRGAEGDEAAPILGRFKINRHFIKAKPAAHRHPGFRQFEGFFDQQARIFRFDVGINQNVIYRLKPCGMRIAKPTAAKPRGAIGHDFKLIHGRAAAQFEQQIKIILGDIGRYLVIRPMRPPAEIRGFFKLRLNDIALPLIEGIAKHFEAVAIIGFKQGHAEIGDRVVSQIARQETDAPFARHMQGGGSG